MDILISVMMIQANVHRTYELEIGGGSKRVVRGRGILGMRTRPHDKLVRGDRRLCAGLEPGCKVIGDLEES